MSCTIRLYVAVRSVEAFTSRLSAADPLQKIFNKKKTFPDRPTLFFPADVTGNPTSFLLGLSWLAVPCYSPAASAAWWLYLDSWFNHHVVQQPMCGVSGLRLMSLVWFPADSEARPCWLHSRLLPLSTAPSPSPAAKNAALTNVCASSQTQSHDPPSARLSCQTFFSV